MPLGVESGEPFLRTDPETGQRVDEAWQFVRTDEHGGFRVEGLAAGTYRLIAQTWSEVVHPEEPLGKNGLTVHLRGVADEVVVPRDDGVVMRPLGDGTLVYNRGAANDDWYLFLSTSAPVADPVLGPLGMRGPFLERGIGFIRMRGGEAIVRGLPEREVSMFLFANDSRPGFGSATFRARSDAIVVRDDNVVTSWSDARHDPPERLASLTAAVRMYFEEGEGGFRKMETLLAAGREEVWEARKRQSGYVGMFEYVDLLGPLDRAVSLPWGGSATVGDLMAASAYVGLQDATGRDGKRQ